MLELEKLLNQKTPSRRSFLKFKSRAAHISKLVTIKSEHKTGILTCNLPVNNLIDKKEVLLPYFINYRYYQKGCRFLDYMKANRLQLSLKHRYLKRTLCITYDLGSL